MAAQRPPRSKRPVRIPFLLSCLALALLLLSACSRPQPAQEPNITDQSFLHDLIDQNTQMRNENDQLRNTLLQYETIITEQNASLKDYFNRLRIEGSTPWEFPQPYARISAEDIRISGSEVIIKVSGAMPVLLADTNSMAPTAASASKIIVVQPTNDRDIHVGDIVGYRCGQCAADEVVMHRVIGIDQDAEGIYYTLKGDNVPAADPGKVRFSQIRTVVVGIIY
jgi:hypothetical protein